MRKPTSDERYAQMMCMVIVPGNVECTHCHGYGTSLKDPVGVNTCTRCGGAGFLVKGASNVPG